MLINDTRNHECGRLRLQCVVTALNIPGGGSAAVQDGVYFLDCGICGAIWDYRDSVVVAEAGDEDQGGEGGARE